MSTMDLPPRQVMQPSLVPLCPISPVAMSIHSGRIYHPGGCIFKLKLSEAPFWTMCSHRERVCSAADGSFRRVQDIPSQEALERLASSQAKDLEILLSRVRSQAESSGLKNGMDEEERRCSSRSRILMLSHGADGLTLVTSGGKCSDTVNTQSIQPDGPNAVTPDPRAAPSVWGTFEVMFSPVKQQVKQKVKDIQQKVEDKVSLLLAPQSQERGRERERERERAIGEEGQSDEKGRIVMTADGHSYEGDLNEQGAMHGYGILRWSDGHCFQVCHRHVQGWILV